jgi:hypothetical protein
MAWKNASESFRAKSLKSGISAIPFASALSACLEDWGAPQNGKNGPYPIKCQATPAGDFKQNP